MNTAAGIALDMNPEIKKAADREALKEAKRNYEKMLSAESCKNKNDEQEA